jgi:hypothetical protein
MLALTGDNRSQEARQLAAAARAATGDVVACLYNLPESLQALRVRHAPFRIGSCCIGLVVALRE